MAIGNFEFYNPTKIYFGKDQIKHVANEIAANSKVLILYGGGSVKRLGTFDRVVQALGNREWDEFGGIEANPVFDTLMKAVDKVKAEDFDYLLAVGGGSVIDGTKFVAAAVKFEGNPIDIFGKGIGEGTPVTEALPFGSILTLPATASEMNGTSVVTFPEQEAKVSFASTAVYPQFSVLEPELTYTLPKKQLANGLSDAYIHVMENYLAYPVDAKVQDRMMEGLLLTLIEESAAYVNEDEENYASNANVMWSATNALNGYTAPGVPTDWSVHKLGHEITVLNGTDHARTLTPILIATMKIRKQQKWDKLLQYAERVWELVDGSEEERVDAAIEKTTEFFQSIEMPVTLGEINVKESDIAYLVSQLEKHEQINISERGDQTAEISREIYLAAL